MDDAMFAELIERHYRELHVYCYRMLGSLETAEDHVQEVFLRAWRSRNRFDGRSSVRTWLYRIATNACLDTLRRTVPRPQPYPDHLLDEKSGPETVVVDRETMSLAFLAMIQLLPPRQRAVVILRDVLSWSAGEAADLLGTTVRAANSALHRARTTIRQQCPDRRLAWAPAGEPDTAQRELLARYIAAHEQADVEALIALLRDDIRLTIEPRVGEWTGRPAVVRALREGMNLPGRWRMVPTVANGQPAAGVYVRTSSQTAFRPFGIAVLSVAANALRAIDMFEDQNLLPAFGLPASLESVASAGSTSAHGPEPDTFAAPGGHQRMAQSCGRTTACSGDHRDHGLVRKGISRPQ